ncbi:MAG: helix-turn-helix domain-containing protein [Gammaproteobacteria bacterium]|nr:helix-turn-helix domain-containing protein [Gammaproteobacteria bacterium]
MWVTKRSDIDDTLNRSDSSTTETWVGRSTALIDTKNQLNAIASSDLPVFISGAEGSGKIIAARSLHDKISHGAFIDEHCELWKNESLNPSLTDIFMMANGGTVFFRNIDLLNSTDVNAIKRYWLDPDYMAKLHPRNHYPMKQARILSSIRSGKDTAPALSPTSDYAEFIDWLNYHSLTIPLKGLAERKADVRALIDFYCNSQEKLNKLRFTPCALNCFEQYGWPGNAKQLRRCLEKLAILHSKERISAGVLSLQFPVMAQDYAKPDADVDGDIDVFIKPHSSPTNQRTIHAMPNNVITLRRTDLELEQVQNYPCEQREKAPTESHVNIPRPVRNALAFIESNYAAKIAMADVAGVACVSEPHLSFLLKKHTGESFKQLLIKIRIDHAVRMLKEHPTTQVTHICSDVGFSDLSHFEKTFKKLIGISPGRYRKNGFQLIHKG